MIIVEIIGGLGNQLFQYATARRLAHVSNQPFKLDLTFFKKYDPSPYRLNFFNIKESIANNDEINKYKSEQSHSLYAKVLKKITGKSILCNGKNHIQQSEFHFNKKVLKVKGDVYLEGYWPNEKYFIDIEKIIRKEFTLINAINCQNKKMANKINSVNAVSLHIRRGDYIGNSFFSECSIDYYYDAINYINSSIDNPHFFIFSDDINWVIDNLKIEFPKEYVDFNDVFTDYEDLRLMSLCKHNIIANSTFSWWGAWLNSNENKIIIAPKIWYNNYTYQKQYERSDFVPFNWKRI